MSGNGQRVLIVGNLSDAPMADLFGTSGGRWVKLAHLGGRATSHDASVETNLALSFDGSTVALGGPVLTGGVFGPHPHARGSVDVFG
jgi:hypothetical protein